MNPPQFVLNALKGSITSGVFVDTKFYVFSRREASGRVGAPRALYCNSHVLNTVPYFSTLFSDAFLEGQPRDINEEFPSDTMPYTELYDYSSDSDLEDESPNVGEGPQTSASTEQQAVSGDEPELQQESHDTKTQTPPTVPCANPLHPAQEADYIKGNHRIVKVAVIRDMAAVTFEAMIYFLYTGEITFAPFTSDPQHNLTTGARFGDWTVTRPPSPSAKSMYRLADKYDIPTLKERAQAHIHNNLLHYNILDEIFSTVSLSFAEILTMQVPWVIKKIKEELTRGAESETKRQLVDKIASLSRSQLARATDALSVILNGVTRPIDPPTVPEPVPTPSVELDIPPNWHRVKSALFKSIHTGTFIDVQFHAYNAIDDNLPLDPKPLFTSSIAIEEYGSAIMTQTVGIDSQAVYLVDGLTDDYECWHGELAEIRSNPRTVLKYQTEAAETTDRAEVVVLVTGAWNTWISLISYAYTNEMTFAPLQTSISSDPPVDAQQQHRPCSPRSMYSLTETLGIENIKGNSLRDIQSKLTASNITQELFTSFSVNHTAVMEMEMEFLCRTFTERDNKSLIDHIQRMASGNASLFPVTLSLVYSKLIDKFLAPPVGSGLGLRDPPVDTGKAQGSTPAPEATPSTTSTPTGSLECIRCQLKQH